MNGLHRERVLQNVRVAEVARDPSGSAMTLKDSPVLPTGDRKKSLIWKHSTGKFKHAANFIEKRIHVRDERVDCRPGALEPPHCKEAVTDVAGYKAWMPNLLFLLVYRPPEPSTGHLSAPQAVGKCHQNHEPIARPYSVCAAKNAQ